MAMNLLGLGLCGADHDEEALSVREAELSMLRRLGAGERYMLAVQSNLAITYGVLGRLEDALRLRRDVYSGHLKLNGEEHVDSLRATLNYANSLVLLKRFAEPKSLLRKTIPMARRVLGASHEYTLKIRWLYGQVLYKDAAATLDDLREAVTTLEDTERIARRVFGGTHPVTVQIEQCLRDSRAALRAREATPPSA